MKPADVVLDYVGLASQYGASAANWNSFVRHSLVDAWLTAYRSRTPWDPEVVEIDQGTMTYLFDAGPTMREAMEGDDRVVAVWGHSQLATTARDRGRQRGFVPDPPTWSNAGRDRGHFVAHAAGGGMDMNLFPQAAGLNRGSSERGKVWRAMERYTVEHPGTALFVRPAYDRVTWVPATIDYGVLTSHGLWYERFDNRG